MNLSKIKTKKSLIPNFGKLSLFRNIVQNVDAQTLYSVLKDAVLPFVVDVLILQSGGSTL